MPYIEIKRTKQYFEWMTKKLFLDICAPKAKTRIVKRGYVYECNFGRCIGSEQEKNRPCVVLQCTDGNRNSPNTIVAPITHTGTKINVVVPIKPQYDQNGCLILDGNVLLGNIVTVSKARLGAEITKLPPNEINDIEIAIIKSLELSHKFNSLQNIIKDKDDYINKLKRIMNNQKLEMDKLRKELELETNKNKPK